MIRIVIENLLLFLTPAAIYFAYVYLTSDQQATNPGTGTAAPKTSIFDGAPYVWLFFAGTALVLLALLTFSSTSGGKPGQTYTPPAMKDGKIQPGHIE